MLSAERSRLGLYDPVSFWWLSGGDEVFGAIANQVAPPQFFESLAQ